MVSTAKGKDDTSDTTYGSISIWRLEEAIFAKSAFTGHGYVKYPGRWNPSGARVVYCSSTLSLAVLEKLVNVSMLILRKQKLVIINATIPSEIVKKQKVVTIKDAVKLNKEWYLSPGPEELRLYGGQWRENKVSAVLKVPSAVIPTESNYILNPHHPDFKEIIVGSPRPFILDPRI